MPMHERVALSVARTLRDWVVKYTALRLGGGTHAHVAVVVRLRRWSQVSGKGSASLRFGGLLRIDCDLQTPAPA